MSFHQIWHQIQWFKSGSTSMIRKSNVYSPLFIPILFLTRQCSPMYLLYKNSQNKTCLHGPKGTLQLAGFLNKLLLWQAIYYNPTAACWGEKQRSNLQLKLQKRGSKNNFAPIIFGQNWQRLACCAALTPALMQRGQARGLQGRQVAAGPTA